MTIDKIWFYYNSVYHLGYVLWAVMYVSALVLGNMQKAGRKREKVGATTTTTKKTETEGSEAAKATVKPVASGSPNKKKD